MENIPSFFEEKINALDIALVELRNGNWAKELTGTNMKREYYKRYKYIISEFEMALQSKLLKEEKEKLINLKKELGNIKTNKVEDYVIEGDGENSQNITTKINYNKGIYILKMIELLFRDIIERLSTKTRTH